MKKYLAILFMAFLLCCSKSGNDSGNNDLPEGSDVETPTNSSPCGTHNGKQLYKGPRGGCYYINSNGNKTYVDRSECSC